MACLTKLGMGRLMIIQFPLPLLLFLFLCSPLLCLARGDHVGRFDVGVILDNSTWIGNISWSCMAMAVEDFYAAHPNYTPRLALHSRNTDKDDVIEAASSAVDLRKNVGVQAIIGPQSSSQAKFLIQLATKVQIPILSFSANCPALSPANSPFFVRTTFNDSSQARVVASLVRSFGWREAVPVFEDTDFGHGIVPFLADAFQDIDAQLPYRSSIPLHASKDDILAELAKLKSMQTRVFVVHMSKSLGVQLFALANAEGMMGEGFVWITTYGLTDVVDLFGSSAANAMQGVVGIRPYVRETEKVRDFKARWGRRFRLTNRDGKRIDVPAFGLFAYDTVWLLAMAAKHVAVANSTLVGVDAKNGSTEFEGVGLSPTGEALLEEISRTKFVGMRGRISVVDGQVDSNVFEIVNVVGDGKKRIGFWTPTYGVSRHVDRKGDLRSVVWPGKQKDKPKGWEWPIKGKNLTIGVPVKPGFSEFVNISIDPQTKQRGYSLAVFDAVMKKLPYHVPYNYVKFEDSRGENNGTYDDLVYQVYLKKFDAVVGDVTIIANRSLYVDFTLPYTDSGVSMLVPVKDKRHKSAWTFLDPLTTDLWLGSGAFFLFTGFVVWILEHRINDEFRGETAHQIGTIFYFSFSTLVFAHREKIVSNLSRVVVIIWVFVVLILQSSYTASLSSILTVQQLQPTVTDLDELLKSGYSVGYLNDSFMPGFLKNLHFNASKLIAYNSPEEYYQALSNGSVAAIVDEIPYIKVFLSKYCSKYTMAGPTYKTDGFGFVFPKGSPLVPDVSRAVMSVKESDTINELEMRLYGNPSCNSAGSGTATSSSLTFNSFWGLFLITGVASMSSLIISLALFLYKHRDALKAIGAEESTRQRLRLLAELFDRRDTSSKAFEKTEATDKPERLCNIYTNSGRQSPMSISTHGNFELEEETGSLPDDEGTSEREISRNTPDPPSFAEMLAERSLFSTS